MVLNILKPDLIMIACICAVVSFFITYLAMPRLIKKLQDAKIVGKDI
ncbi:MAG TPA: multidrug transporter, partial [Methanobacterium sp.]|nr:multidrug transporter [Methanobacterium sp.]